MICIVLMCTVGWGKAAILLKVFPFYRLFADKQVTLLPNNTHHASG